MIDPHTPPPQSLTCLDWLFIVYHPVRKYLTRIGTSPLFAYEGLQNLDLCSAPRGIVIVPYSLWHGTSVYTVLFKELLRSVAPYGKAGVLHEDFFKPGSSLG